MRSDTAGGMALGASTQRYAVVRDEPAAPARAAREPESRGVLEADKRPGAREVHLQRLAVGLELFRVERSHGPVAHQKRGLSRNRLCCG